MTEPDNLERLAELTARLPPVIDSALFAQILDALPDGLIVIDSDGIIQHVNQQVAFMFGYPRRALIGQKVHILLPPGLRELHEQYVAQFFSHPTVRPMNKAQTLTGQHKSGKPVRVQISLGPVEAPQGVLGLALVRRVA